MSAGRHIVARTIVQRADGCYAGTMTLFGYAYFLEITRSGDGLQIVAFDGPAVGPYRQPLIDDVQE